MKKKLQPNSPEFKDIVANISSTKISLPPLQKNVFVSTPELPKDVSEVTVNNLSPQELINLCASEARPDFKRMCDSNDFWVRRWEKDFPVLKDTPFYNKFEAKNKYLQLFSSISEGAEKMVETILLIFGDFRNFLTKEYKQILYKYFYDHILNLLNTTSKKEVDEDYFYELGYGGINLSNFKKSYIPEFVRNDRNYYDEFWSDVLSEVTSIIVRIIKNLKLFKLKQSQIIPSPSLSGGFPELPRIPSNLGSPRF